MYCINRLSSESNYDGTNAAKLWRDVVPAIFFKTRSKKTPFYNLVGARGTTLQCKTAVIHVYLSPLVEQQVPVRIAMAQGSW